MYAVEYFRSAYGRNKRMKRIWAFILTVMLLLSLAACAINDTAQDDIKGHELSFTEKVVVDNDECAIVITGIEPDSMWGFTLNVQLENKSDSTVYTYIVESAAANGVQVETLFYEKVEPGEKSDEKIYFWDDDLVNNGVGEFTDAKLTFRVYDGSSDEDDVVNVTVHVYPYGKDEAERYIRRVQNTDNVIVDNEYAKVIIMGYDENSFWGYDVKLFIENKTNTTLVLSLDDASVNGIMIEPLYTSGVSAGNCIFNSVTWCSGDLIQNGISEVETIEFKLIMYSDDNWTRDTVEDFLKVEIDITDTMDAADFLVNKTITLRP